MEEFISLTTSSRQNIFPSSAGSILIKYKEHFK